MRILLYNNYPCTVAKSKHLKLHHLTCHMELKCLDRMVLCLLNSDFLCSLEHLVIKELGARNLGGYDHPWDAHWMDTTRSVAFSAGASLQNLELELTGGYDTKHPEDIIRTTFSSRLANLRNIIGEKLEVKIR